MSGVWGAGYLNKLRRCEKIRPPITRTTAKRYRRILLLAPSTTAMTKISTAQRYATVWFSVPGIGIVKMTGGKHTTGMPSPSRSGCLIMNGTYGPYAATKSVNADQTHRLFLQCLCQETRMQLAPHSGQLLPGEPRRS